MATIMMNVDEVFEIALQIERNGAAFYRKAAGAAGDKACREELEKLAAMEEDHEQTFEQLRETIRVREPQWALQDANGEAAQYLAAFAEGQVFDLTGDPLGFLAAPKSLRDILKRAIELERDSILYYLGMKEVVPPGLGRDEIDGIIQQEKGHIALLNGRLALLGCHK